MFKNRFNKKGQSYVEVIMATAISAIILGAIYGLTSVNLQVAEVKANGLRQESNLTGLETARKIMKEATIQGVPVAQITSTSVTVKSTYQGYLANITLGCGVDNNATNPNLKQVLYFQENGGAPKQLVNRMKTTDGCAINYIDQENNIIPSSQVQARTGEIKAVQISVDYSLDDSPVYSEKHTVLSKLMQSI